MAEKLLASLASFQIPQKTKCGKIYFPRSRAQTETKKLHGPLTSHFVQLLLISIGQDKSNVTCKQLIGTRNIKVHMFRMRSKQSEPFSFCCLHL